MIKTPIPGKIYRFKMWFPYYAPELATRDGQKVRVMNWFPEAKPGEILPGAYPTTQVRFADGLIAYLMPEELQRCRQTLFDKPRAPRQRESVSDIKTAIAELEVLLEIAERNLAEAHAVADRYLESLNVIWAAGDLNDAQIDAYRASVPFEPAFEELPLYESSSPQEDA